MPDQRKKSDPRSSPMIASRYELIERLGSGGMGDVYKVKDTKLKRTVALKFLSRDLTRDADAKKRFVHEAQAASALEHPNICAIYEVDETDDGQMYISMSFCKGESLASKMKDERLKIKDVIDYGLQIAEGLKMAHQAGIVHRDIKPANIIVSEDNGIKIVDFGLAKLSGSKNLTKEGSTVGTVSYMSPEQTRGEAVESRTDIWALGVVLYEMLSGQVPFKGDYDQAIVYSILNEQPQPLSEINKDIPGWLEDITMRMLRKNAEERYQDIGDVITALKQTAETEKAGWFRRLLDRRVVQITGLYLIASWLIIQAVNWAIERFLLSPHLSDFSMITLLCLLPTVLLISFYHRKDSRAKWPLVEKVGIPLNVIILAGILFFVFWGKDLGATQTTVTYEDEQGNTIKRTIPKSEFRKSIAIFPFDYSGGDTTLTWLHNGMMFLFLFDLAQDLYLNPEPAFYEHNSADMRAAGFPTGLNLPLSFKAKTARNLYKEYFVSGDFQYKNNEYILNVDVYRAKGLKHYARISKKGVDLFKLVDQITVEIKRELGIPEKYLENCEDYPLSEIATKSLDAMKYYVLGDNQYITDFNYSHARKYFEKAVEYDSSFVIGYLKLAQAADIENRPDLENWAMEKMIKYIYRLPGKFKIMAKRTYYERKGEKEKGFALAKMAVELYPEDMMLRESLAREYLGRGDVDQAIDQYKAAMGDASDEARIIQRIGRLFMNRRQFDQALQFYKNYADKNPDDYRSFSGLGEAYLTMGSIDKAKVNYEKAQLLEPDNLGIELRLAEVDMKSGDFENAQKRYENELHKRKTPEEREEIYFDMATYYEQRGQIVKTIESLQNAIEEHKRSAQFYELYMYSIRGHLIDLYAMIGQIDSLNKVSHELESVFGENYKHLTARRKLFAFSRLEQADSIEAILGDLTRKYNKSFSMARIAEINGQYSEALKNFNDCLESSTGNFEEEYTYLGRIYRKMENFEDGKEALDEAFQLNSYYAPALYEKAILYWEMDEKEEAIRILQKALDIWKNADARYFRAKKARELMAEWQRKDRE